MAADTSIHVAYEAVTAADGNREETIGTVRYDVAVIEPLSGEASLSDLTVSNAAIHPASALQTSQAAGQKHPLNRQQNLM